MPSRSQTIALLFTFDPSVTLTGLAGILTWLGQAVHTHFPGIKGLAMFDFIYEFSDVAVYFWMASAGTGLLFIRVMLSLAFGLGDDMDIDGEFDGDAGGSFTVFSILSILSFIAGTGWMGLLARMEWELSPTLGALVAASFGLSLGLIASFAMFQMRKLASEAEYKIENCVNSLGRVYVTIPEKGEGSGQVQVTVDGRRRIFRAVSDGPAYAAFKDVKIISVLGENALVVGKPDA